MAQPGAPAPELIAPQFNQPSGPVSRGFAFSLTNLNPAGSVFYTTDGVDPRTPVHSVYTNAQSFARAVAVNRSVTIKARARLGTNWSALAEASYSTTADYTKLLITELAYQPPGTNDMHESSREFVELKNVGTETLDLSGVRFQSYSFPTNTTIAPGEFKVLVRDTNAYLNDHPGGLISGGPFARLSNSGGQAALLYPSGTVLFDLTYLTHGPWPTLPDDHNFSDRGFSMVTVDPNAVRDAHHYSSWRTSMLDGGSPGADDPPDTRPHILVTEVLARPGDDGYPLEALELFNPHATNVDIGGWFISDSRPQPKGFQLPPNTIVPAGGYLVLDENTFARGTPNDIAFHSAGEAAYLFSASPQGKLQGYGHGFDFSGSERGMTYGLHVNSFGEESFVPQVRQTLGEPNAGPRLGPAVVTEFMYNPPAGELIFVEMLNLTDAPLPLYDPAFPLNSWSIQLGGLFFFPSNAVVPARSLFLVVEGDPESFRTRYSVPAHVPVYGPLQRFANFFEVPLYLQRPSGIYTEPGRGTFARQIPVDVIDFRRKFPWPAGANEGGCSLERIALEEYGSDPRNWRESPTESSPGRTNSGNVAPKVHVAAPPSPRSGQAVMLTAYVEDDGLPRNPGVVTYRWSRLSGPGAVDIAQPDALTTAVSFHVPGTNWIQFSASDGTVDSVVQLSVVVAASPFDRWRADHFSTQDLEETSISGEAADPDFDGISNIEEYSYRLDPWQPEPKPFIVRLVDGRLTVTFRKWMAATDVGLIAEGADSVVGPWHAGDVRVELSGAGPTGFHDGILQDQLASPRSRFLRWRWVRQ